MPSGRLLHLFLPFLGFGVIAATTAASAQTTQPAFGDQVFENIDFPDGRKLSLVQTTVVCIPGFEWVVTGQPVGSDGKPLPQVLSLAVWTVQSLPGGKSMFSRFFSLVGSEGSVTVSRSKNGALDPVGSKAALERLKKYLEGSQEKN